MGALGVLAKYPVLPEARDWLRAEGPALDLLLSDFLYGRARDRAKQRVWAALEDDGRKKQPRTGGASGSPRAADPRDVPPSSFGTIPGAGSPGFEDPIGGSVSGQPLMLSDVDAEMELVSHPLSRMLVAATGEDLLVRRYAVHESKRLSAHLERDPAETVSAVARALDVPFVRREPEDDPSGATGKEARTFGLHFTDYLARAPNEKTWKLPWRDLEAGHVWLDKEDFSRLLENVYKGKLEDDLTGQSAAVPGIVRETMGDEIERLKAEAARRMAAYRQAQALEVDEKRFPPCMDRILQDMHEHKNIPHMGRFAIVAFLNTLGLNADQILKFFSTIPDFNADKSRYQIEHITGKGGPTEYTPPGCATMQTYGVCPLEERDDICADVKHPLSYYRRNLWRKRNERPRKEGKDGRTDDAEGPQGEPEGNGTPNGAAGAGTKRATKGTSGNPGAEAATREPSRGRRREAANVKGGVA